MWCKAGQHAAALRQLLSVFARIMRGELGVALQSMRMAMADERRARELAAMQAAGIKVPDAQAAAEKPAAAPASGS